MVELDVLLRPGHAAPRGHRGMIRLATAPPILLAWGLAGLLLVLPAGLPPLDRSQAARVLTTTREMPGTGFDVISFCLARDPAAALAGAATGAATGAGQADRAEGDE